MKKLIHFCRLAWKESPSYILLLALQALAVAGKLWLNVILPKFLVEELTGHREVQVLCLLAVRVRSSRVLAAPDTVSHGHLAG